MITHTVVAEKTWLVHFSLSMYFELLYSSKYLHRNYVLCMELASYSAAMNHFTCSFIHIHMVWHGLKYYTVLLMCCACKCVHLISDLFNTLLIFKKIFFFCGEGCDRVNFLIVFVFCLGLF